MRSGTVGIPFVRSVFGIAGIALIAAAFGYCAGKDKQGWR